MYYESTPTLTVYITTPPIILVAHLSILYLPFLLLFPPFRVPHGSSARRSRVVDESLMLSAILRKEAHGQHAQPQLSYHVTLRRTHVCWKEVESSYQWGKATDVWAPDLSVPAITAARRRQNGNNASELAYVDDGIGMDLSLGTALYLYTWIDDGSHKELWVRSTTSLFNRIGLERVIRRFGSEYRSSSWIGRSSTM